MSLTCTKFLYSALGFLFIAAHGIAGTVDTVSIESPSMHKQINCVVIKPDSYKKKKNHFPVVYLLHGYDGSFRNWIMRVPELKDYADEYQTIIVCPDGNISSWYFNSPVDSTYRYETHIADEVVSYIDTHYKTISDKEHRAITGLSMGGHGAFYLALRHPDKFGAAGSMSGGMDLKESKNKFDIAKRIGDTITHAGNWMNMAVIYLVENYRNTPVKLIFDCGNKDIFIRSNRMLHQKMLELNIPHSYTERPGEHNWNYWRNSLPYHLLYFRKFFNSK